MMNLKTRSFPSWLKFAAASLVLLPVLPVCAQNAPAANAGRCLRQAKPRRPCKPPPKRPAQPTDRAQAYYHVAMASIYEDDATSEGQPEFINRAIEEYKLALNADPDSPQINDALADLYFRVGHIHDAEVTARDLLKISPNDVDAHKLLGRIYLRQLGEGENAGASASHHRQRSRPGHRRVRKDRLARCPRASRTAWCSDSSTPSSTIQRRPKSSSRPRRPSSPIQRKSSSIWPASTPKAATSQHAAKVIEAVPVDDRTAKMEFTLGAAYDQLKQPKDAIAAYQRAADIEPGDPHTLEALAQALLSNNQLDEALKQYQQLAEADPENAEPLVHIAEIQRRQGKY